MHYKEFGKENARTILLLHGGGLSWWNYRKEAELLKQDYHVILPIVDGHAGSGQPFVSMKKNAEEIIAFIDEHLGGSVLCISGLSLGAQIVLEILSLRKDICRYAVIESAAVIPSKITNALIGPSFSSSYGLIKSRTFAKLQFASLHMDDDYFEEYYRDTCLISKEDMIAFMKANTSYALSEGISSTSAEVHVFYGEKETKQIRESAKLIASKIPECHIECLSDLYHGEFSLNHPDEYVNMLKRILNE